MVLIGLYFVFKTYNGFQIPLPKELRILLLLLVATDILVLIGSFLFKFSLRTLVFSVILGYVFVNNYFSYRNSLLLYSLLILFMGANASFELKQNKNSLREVTVSFAIGILLSSSFVLLLLN
jgi:ABC-type iron transport system FetAB permease component